MKLRSPGGRRSTERERSAPGAPRSPRARRLQNARDERRTRLKVSGPGGAGSTAEDRTPVEITAVLPGTGETAAAVVLFGGLLLIAMPQHAGTIVRVLLVALSAVAALWAITRVMPEAGVSGWWRSPFDPPGSRRPAEPRGAVERVRASLATRRQQIPGARPLPAETIRMVQPLIAVALERRGLDPDDAAHRPAIQRALSPLALGVLTSDPRYLPRWYETRRPDARRTADAVRRILDELESL